MMNRCMVIGHVGQDPEQRFMPSGDPVTNFSVATTNRWKDRNGAKQESTEWFNCAAFGALADVVVKYVKKGSRVYIDGPMQSSEYTDRDGIKRRNWRLRVENLKLLDRAPDAAKALADLPDDIPF